MSDAKNTFKTYQVNSSLNCRQYVVSDCEVAIKRFLHYLRRYQKNDRPLTVQVSVMRNNGSFVHIANARVEWKHGKFETNIGSVEGEYYTLVGVYGTEEKLSVQTTFRLTGTKAQPRLPSEVPQPTSLPLPVKEIRAAPLNSKVPFRRHNLAHNKDGYMCCACGLHVPDGVIFGSFADGEGKFLFACVNCASNPYMFFAFKTSLIYTLQYDLSLSRFEDSLKCKQLCNFL